MNRQIHLAAPREVLDVTIPAVLRAAGDGARAFLADFFFDGVRGGAGMYGLGFGWLGDDALEGGGGDKFGFAGVPFGEDGGAGGAAEDARVDEAGEFEAGDMARGAVDAGEVPDGFGAGGGKRLVGGDWERRGRDGVLRFRVVLVEEPATVVFVEDASEAPGVVLEGLNVLNLDEEDVAWFGGFDLEGAGEVVDLG